MNRWEELRKWVFHRQDLVTQNKMRELEAATHREIMDGKTGLYWIDIGTLEWAVHQTMNGNTTQHKFGDLQRTLKKGDYPDMMFMEHKWKMYPTVHTTMIPKTGWYAEKKINTPIWDIW